MATDPRIKLRSMIEEIEVGMMTTVDEDGSLRSRPMWLCQDDHGDAMWFFTRASSHKVAEVTQDQHVNISFAEPRKQAYVSVSGMAQLVRDRGRAQSLWTEPLRAWFPQGLDDPDLALLKITPTKAEYWDSPSSAMVHLFGYVKAATTGRPAKGGEHGQVDLQ